MSEINKALVEALVAEQFPQWSDQPVTQVAEQGWDNRTFRLGDELAVRLPSAARYAGAINKEDAVLPALAAVLSIPVPEPVAAGVPSPRFPFAWSVRRWLPGRPLSMVHSVDEHLLAQDLAKFITQMHAAPTEHGPAAGGQSFFRGCHPSAYSDEVARALEVLADRVDVGLCRKLWLEATLTVWSSPPVWVHGDLSAGNMLLGHHRLSAVIDFGCCAVGDPACDLALAWTLLAAPGRGTFRDCLNIDAGTWTRARAWVLWKALVSMAGSSGSAAMSDHERDLAAALQIA